jgi:hypothetical protein
MRVIGIRERTDGLKAGGSGLVRVLSDIGHAPSLVNIFTMPLSARRPVTITITPAAHCCFARWSIL